MATRSASRHRSVPINVTVERRSRTPRPGSPATPPHGQSQGIQPSSRGWSEAHRRRIMWISVGLGTLVILIGSISVFSAQIQGNAPTFFGDATRLIRSVHWPWDKPPATKNEQEIRHLEEQVFPQFQK